MQRPLLLILAYVSIDCTHAFSTRLPSSNRRPVDACAASREQLGFSSTHDRKRHCTSALRSPSLSTMMSRGAGESMSGDWPPADRLSEYVAESSLVDYGRLATQEKEWLAPVISSIKATDHREMDSAEQSAFLINAYNLWTLHWVVRERRFFRWKGAVSLLAKVRFFYWHKVSTAGGKWNLYDFENKVIRPQVNDARVHFALNCASISCPPLRRKLFSGSALEAELDEVTSAAINGGAFVQASGDGTLRVNPIFKWYKEDFDKEGGALAFIRKHWTGTPLPENATIDFFEYDWRSNNVDATWADRALGGPAP